jgi:hypothetical protein
MICPTTGKTSYHSEKEAVKGLKRFLEKVPDYEGEPYMCMYCGSYHFGSRKKPDKRKRS